LDTGRGLGKFQKAILKYMGNSIDIFGVDKIVWREKNKHKSKKGKKGLIYMLGEVLREGKTEVKDIRNFKALYRMMEGLVKRGLVGRILHVRPTIWIALKNGKPTIEAIRSNLKLWNLAMRGKLTIQIGDEIGIYSLKETQEKN
jgi:hypothetical protein